MIRYKTSGVCRRFSGVNVDPNMDYDRLEEIVESVQSSQREATNTGGFYPPGLLKQKSSTAQTINFPLTCTPALVRAQINCC